MLEHFRTQEAESWSTTDNVGANALLYSDMVTKCRGRGGGEWASLGELTGLWWRDCRFRAGGEEVLDCGWGGVGG